MATISDDRVFLDEWNDLDRLERSRLRRVTRLGRKIDEPRLAELAAGYARYQVRRPWLRYFWVWFVPGIVVALSMAAQIHPVLVGVVIVLGAQAVWANISLKRAARSAR